MKKILIVILFAILAICLNANLKNSFKVFASSKSCYARVMAENVYLYKNAIDNEDFSNIYFELPRTYFVELIGDYNSNFYTAKYLNITGYVKKDCVTAISGLPNNPFLSDVCFRVYSEQSQNLRKLPTSAGGADNQEYFLPQDNLNITYIGKIFGEQLVKNRSNVWFYCKFVDSSEHFGYVYSEFCDDGEGNDLIIPLNNEEVIYTTSPNFSNEESETTSLAVESKTTWIIITILSIPALIFVLMFLKGGKVFSKNKKLPNKEIKDY